MVRIARPLYKRTRASESRSKRSDLDSDLLIGEAAAAAQARRRRHASAPDHRGCGCCDSPPAVLIPTRTRPRRRQWRGPVPAGQPSVGHAVRTARMLHTFSKPLAWAGRARASIGNGPS